MNQWKSAQAVKTAARTLEQALDGADVFLGLSVKGAMTPAMVKAMAARPIIFACANPDPEITPEEVAAVRGDAIVATGAVGLSQPGQQRARLPLHLPRALDVRARTINDAMKIAAAQALAELAREDVPDEVSAAYGGAASNTGQATSSPCRFDPRLIARVPVAVAKAAMATGVAQKAIVDLDAYAHQLSARLDPVASILQRITNVVRASPKRIVFAEGEEESVIRAAFAYEGNGLGEAVLVGRPDRIAETLKRIGLPEAAEIEVVNPLESPARGRLRRPALRAAAAQGLAASRLRPHGHVRPQRLRRLDGGGRRRGRDGHRRHAQLHGRARLRVAGAGAEARRTAGGRVHDPRRGRTVFVADTNVHDMPSPEELADIATLAAGVARRFGFEPRVAFLAYSTFGYPTGERSQVQRDAVAILEGRNVDFEFDGEMAADVALNREAMALYPFSRLKGPANVLVMPAIHSASISTKMLQELGGSTVMGPFRWGWRSPCRSAPSARACRTS